MICDLTVSDDPVSTIAPLHPAAGGLTASINTLHPRYPHAKNVSLKCTFESSSEVKRCHNNLCYLSLSCQQDTADDISQSQVTLCSPETSIGIETEQKSIFTLLLEQVAVAVSSGNEPTVEDCLTFLKIFHPELSSDWLRTKAQRTKLLKDAKLRVLRDLLPFKIKSKDRAAEFSQNFEKFMTSCNSLDFAPLKRKASSMTVPFMFPENFHTHKKWPCLVRPDKFNGSSFNICYHMRGQLLHYSYAKKDIKMVYSHVQVSHFKYLKYPNDIVNTETLKAEIHDHGPAVSTSYKQAQGTCTENDYPLIIGWETREVQGEVWILRIPSKGNKDFYVAFGTCQIEEKVMIPFEDLTTKKWQLGRYLKTSETNDSWKTGTAFMLRANIQIFINMCKVLEVTKASELLAKKVEFHVFSGTNIADSRTVYLHDFEIIGDLDIKIHLKSTA